MAGSQASYVANSGYYDANNGPANVLLDLQTCSSNFVAGNAAVNSDQDKGYTWTSGSPGITLFNTIVPPCSTQYKWSACRFGCLGCGADFGQYTNASSNHPGGANVAMADGSGRFIKSSININTWWALGTKANSEVISSDAY